MLREIIHVLGLFFDLLSMQVCLYSQALSEVLSGRLVQELNVCTVHRDIIDVLLNNKNQNTIILHF